MATKHLPFKAFHISVKFLAYLPIYIALVVTVTLCLVIFGVPFTER